MSILRLVPLMLCCVGIGWFAAGARHAARLACGWRHLADVAAVRRVETHDVIDAFGTAPRL